MSRRRRWGVRGEPVLFRVFRGSKFCALCVLLWLKRFRVLFWEVTLALILTFSPEEKEQGFTRFIIR
jgi:hypothetical protein